MKILKKIMHSSSERNAFTLGKNKQIDFMKKLHVPKNDLERSYNQYKCQVYLQGNRKKIILNCASLIALLPVTIKFLFNKETYVEKKKSVLLTSALEEDLLPKRYNHQTFTVTDNKKSLGKEELKIIGEIIRKYPFSYYFILKIIYKLALYRSAIKRYNPNEIIVSSEYSYTSSILTEYCEANDIKHINIMHGEKIFDIVDAYFRFSECYVWDAHYIKIFKNLNAEEKQFKIEMPRKILGCTNERINKSADYKYYLQAENETEIEKISIIMKKLQKKGYTVAVRKHPLYTKENLIEKYFGNIKIEDKNISINESILETKGIISKFSTVLLQAYNMNVDAIIDDVTEPNLLERLQELEYIILDKKHYRLSEIMK